MPTLDELEAQIRDLQERLRVTTMLAEAMRAYEAAVGPKPSETSKVAPKPRAQSGRRASPAMSDTEKAATDLMVRTGAPAPTAAVIQEMRSQGMTVPVENAPNIISARLSNNNRFKAKRGVGYWFADRPWPGEEDQSLPGFNENEASADHSEDASDAAQHALAEGDHRNV